MTFNEHAETHNGLAADPLQTFSGRKRHMSSQITPLQSAGQSSTVSPLASAPGAGSFASELASSERAGAVEVLRGGPPADVVAQIAAAGDIHERLQQEGRELRFSLPEAGGRVTIELLDSTLLSSTAVSGVEALDIAAGLRE